MLIAPNYTFKDVPKGNRKTLHYAQSENPFGGKLINNFLINNERCLKHFEGYSRQ